MSKQREADDTRNERSHHEARDLQREKVTTHNDIQLLYDMSHELILSIRADEEQAENWRIMRGNATACSVLGYTFDELLSLPLGDITVPSLMHFWRGWVLNADPGVPIASNWKFVTRSGEQLDVDMRLLVRDAVTSKELLIVAQPGWGRHGLGEFQGNPGDLYELMAEYTSDLVAIIDLNRDVVFASPSHLSVLGFDPSQDKLGLLQAIHPNDLEALQRTYLDVFQTGRTQSVELRLKNKAGDFQLFESRVSIIPRTATTPTRLVTVSMDITKRREAEQELRQMAYHDALTRLGNRRLFVEHVESMLARWHSEQKGTGVLVMIDLNEFKNVNDSFGHAIGDMLLQEVAKRLLEVAPDGSLVARMGGDEFTVVSGKIDQFTVFEFCRTLSEALGRPYELHGQRIDISASVGGACIPDDGDSVDQLLSAADVAMYEDKQRHREFSDHKC